MRYVTALVVGLVCWGCAGTPVAQEDVEPAPNIAIQPAWGPTGYDYVENYYLPDIEVYYHVPTHEYVYLDRGDWQRSPSLPSRYRNYDLYRSYKVVINAHQPWRVHEYYKDGYSGFRSRHDQVSIRDSKDAMHFEPKDPAGHKRLAQSRKPGKVKGQVNVTGKLRKRKGGDHQAIASH